MSAFSRTYQQLHRNQVNSMWIFLGIVIVLAIGWILWLVLAQLPVRQTTNQFTIADDTITAIFPIITPLPDTPHVIIHTGTQTHEAQLVTMVIQNGKTIITLRPSDPIPDLSVITQVTLTIRTIPAWQFLWQSLSESFTG